MTTMTCDAIRDSLPEFVREVLPAGQMAVIESHLATCAECRAERDVITVLTRPATVPAGLEERVIRAVRKQRRPTFSPGGLAMAATVVFALVTAGVVSQMGLLESNSRAREDLAGAPSVDWTRGDPVLLRGGLDLSALSEDELLKLLEEMDS
jgi:predicted anti-sigma-YlaC factor YlaD